MRRTVLGLWLILCLGCGGGDRLNRAAVEGKVTLDGAPVQEGVITFLPTAGTKGPTAGGRIENGRYSLSGAAGPVVGTHRVEIRAPRATGEQKAHPMQPDKKVDVVAESIPKKYNSESTLKHDIKPGKNVLDFELSSK